jgi:hypothetical protein
MNRLRIVLDITKCDECPSVTHKAYLAKVKTEFHAKRKYFCKIDNQKLTGHRIRIPDTCPRLKEQGV